ncbi:hypothetical protein [Pedobacter metabolipauper]|uniref:Tail tube protein n=1 Tax=Pedobacter metabolipauper TaxID=425513 RepID=A0A4R6T138_9SPHI|nr:hypothetical protein [Pedobacter metabolipauper]TDQ12162.1 hypothetical protein ATK78_1294 [Pedobacter metabolipauper]
MGKVLGLKSFLMGDPALDGGMGLTLTEVFGATVKGSATLTATEATTEEIEIEELDTIYDELTTKAPVWTLKASTYNISATTMQKLFGGTIIGTAPALTWKAPIGGAVLNVYQSVTAESRSGIKFNFVKMKLSGVPTIAFDKAKLGQLDFTLKMLAPDKAATPAMEIVFV